MVRFDWAKFLTERGIPYVTRGPNTARNHVSVRCPFCGIADPSQHMGLNLDVRNPVWGCFRNAAHRGGHPRRLVQKLLGVSYAEAQRIVAVAQEGSADDAELSAAMDALRGSAEQAEVVLDDTLVGGWPREFRPLPGVGEYAARFTDYLMERGFPAEDLPGLCARYELHYALTGAYAWRVLLPIREQYGRALGWTGREIRAGAALRYKTSPQLPARAVYNAHGAFSGGAGVLVVVEGPLDALKLDYYGRDLGVAAVAVMGTAVPAERRAALAVLARRFGRVAVLFDRDTLPEVLGLAGDLAAFCSPAPEVWRLDAAKDPGELSEAEVHAYLLERGV